MSGASGIAAAKNRRSKTEPNQKQLPPPISCGKNNSCPPQKSAQNSKAVAPTNPMDLVDPTSLQILGPMPPVQILRFHEQRLNRFDERLSQLASQAVSSACPESAACNPTGDCAEMDDCYDRIESLESKLAMLEEVIMTLQNKLTIAQNFSMETNMNMSALMKKHEHLQTQQTQQASISTIVDITQSMDETCSLSLPTSPTESASPQPSVE
jgi:uncharacterized coiled-coil protein SlyX